MDKSNMIAVTREKAEGYYRRGEFFCSEAVVHAINELLGWPLPKEATKLASAFPVGIGKSKCLCGAISGGAMALGMAYGRSHGEPMHERMFPVAAALHDYVKASYGSTCCRVLIKDYDFASPERKAHCVRITGEVTAWVTEQLLADSAVAKRIEAANAHPEAREAGAKC